MVFGDGAGKSSSVDLGIDPAIIYARAKELEEPGKLESITRHELADMFGGDERISRIVEDSTTELPSLDEEDLARGPSDIPETPEIANRLDAALGEILTRYTEKTHPDARYPYVTGLADTDEVRLKLIKKDRAEGVARHEALALMHLRHLFGGNGVRAYPINNSVVVEFVNGPTAYDIQRYMASSIQAFGGDVEELADPDKRDIVLKLRRAFLERQVDRVAIFQSFPYVPHTQAGEEIKSNINGGGLNEYYTSRFIEALNGTGSNTLEKAVNVFDNILDNTETAYGDWYGENDVAALGLEDNGKELKRIIDTQDETAISAFVERVLQYKVDVHHITKRANRAEDLHSVVGDPQLNTTGLAQTEHAFSLDQHLALYQRFELQKARLEKQKKSIVCDNGLNSTLAELISNNGKPLEHSKMQSALQDEQYNLENFLGMGLYRAVRRSHLVDNGIEEHRRRIETLWGDLARYVGKDDAGDQNQLRKALHDAISNKELRDVKGVLKDHITASESGPFSRGSADYRARIERTQTLGKAVINRDGLLYAIGAIEYCQQKARHFDHDRSVYLTQAKTYVKELIDYTVEQMRVGESEGDIQITMPVQNGDVATVVKRTKASPGQNCVDIYYGVKGSEHHVTEEGHYSVLMNNLDNIIGSDGKHHLTEIQKVVQLKYIQRTLQDHSS